MLGAISITIMTLGAMSLTISSCILPGEIPVVTGIDEETGIIFADPNAVDPAVKKALEDYGFKIEEIDARQEAIDKKVDEIAEVAGPVGSAIPIPGDLKDLLLLYLFGSVGVRDGGGIIRKIAQAKNGKKAGGKKKA